MRLPWFCLSFFNAVLLFSCTNNKTANTSLKIAATPISSNALICLANSKNKISKLASGWEVIEVLNSEDGLDLLRNDKVDIAITEPNAYFLNFLKFKESKDQPFFKILAGINNIQNSITIITPKNSMITEIKELKNKKLGHTGKVSDFFRTYFFLTEGLSETSIKQVLFKSSDKLMVALNSKKIDAAIIPNDSIRISDKSDYNFFVSSVHEVTSQVVSKEAVIRHKKNAILDFLSALIFSESVLYSDTEIGLENLKSCYPDSDENFMSDLIKRRDLRVLIDESLRNQYSLYQKWLLSQPEYKSSSLTIKNFDLNHHLNPLLLKDIDFRRVLIK